MKLFKVEIERKREGRDLVVHAEEEEDALARVRAKYTGWTIGRCDEVVGEAHFTIAFADVE